MDTFFSNIEIPAVDEQTNANLEQPITLGEICDSIRDMSSGVV